MKMTVATDEIQFGDNDKLAALTAVLLKVDILIIAIPMVFTKSFTMKSRNHFIGNRFAINATRSGDSKSSQELAECNQCQYKPGLSMAESDTDKELQWIKRRFYLNADDAYNPSIKERNK
jgi:glutamate 5-kinase